MSLIQGKVWKFGDFISTDLIAPGRYFHLRSNLVEFSKHVLEDANPNFAREVRPGDVVVAGKNFGLGSSREHAPAIMKMAGVSAVVAESFSRIFFRNAVNIGLTVITVPVLDLVEEGDRVEIDLAAGILRNLSRGGQRGFKPLPSFMIHILSDGGIINNLIKNRGFSM